MDFGRLHWKTGVEVELLAPAGLSRGDLARAVAERASGAARRIFYPQAEPSLVPGKPVFESLTLGFRAVAGDGEPLGDFVDDLTLQDDLDKERQPAPGWYRIAGDDARLLRLVARFCDARAPLETVLLPAVDLFAGSLTVQGPLHRLLDSAGHPVAIAAPLPGERERPTEIITPPLERDHAAKLANLLDAAAGLGFSAPAEGATHLHFDAVPLQDARVVQRLVRLFAQRRQDLRGRFRPNPRCRRLGPWDDTLVEAVEEDGFAALPWEEARRRLVATGPTKFCDFNLVNLLAGRPEKLTFEVRILPVTLDAAELLEAIGLFQHLLDWAVGDRAAMPSV